MSKPQAELFGPRLKERNLVQIKTKVCYFCNRDENLKDSQCHQLEIVFFNNVYGLMIILDIEYNHKIYQ